jgi:pantetheine-phosphate adenylyltransferase
MEKVGVYAGSFNPFHLGHYNILLKGEKIFDKVILGFGKNPEKQDSNPLIPSELINRKSDIRYYDGLLTDFINSLEFENITLIRGLRNSTDLQYELTQYRFLQELKPDIKVVSIFCDKEYEHISSSAIRKLMMYGKGSEYILK